MANKMIELERPECLRLLQSCAVGRLAVAIGDGAPMIRPVNYVYDPRSQAVVFRTAPGSKLYALGDATRAAFEVDGIDDASRTGWSVIISGVTEEVTNPAELRRLGRLDVQPWEPGEKAHWVRIRAWTVSGRRIVSGAAAAG